MSDQRYAYHPGFFKPIALVGETLAIWYSNGWNYFIVHNLLSIPPSQIAQQNFGAIGAVATVANLQFTNLTVQNGEFLQIRIWPLDDVQVQMFQPATGNALHFVTNLAPLPIDVFTIIDDPDLVTTEMYIYEEGSRTLIPWCTITNPTQYALTRSVVAFMGHRFSLKPDETLTSAHPARTDISKVPAGRRVTFVPGSAFIGGTK